MDDFQSTRFWSSDQILALFKAKKLKIKPKFGHLVDWKSSNVTFFLSAASLRENREELERENATRNLRFYETPESVSFFSSKVGALSIAYAPFRLLYGPAHVSHCRSLIVAVVKIDLCR